MRSTADDRMTKRLTISIDDDIYDALEVRAEKEVRSLANLAAAIVTQVIREDLEKSDKGGKS